MLANVDVLATEVPSSAPDRLPFVDRFSAEERHPFKHWQSGLLLKLVHAYQSA